MTTLHVPRTTGVITHDQALDALHLLGIDPINVRDILARRRDEDRGERT